MVEKQYYKAEINDNLTRKEIQQGHIKVECITEEGWEIQVKFGKRICQKHSIFNNHGIY